MATLTQHRSNTAASATSPNAPFTPEMRDRQARGKNPYVKDNSSSSNSANADEAGAASTAGVDWERRRYSVKDDYHERERKELAMAVLDCPEKMLMYAQANDDSVAGQRLAFMKALRGPLSDEGMARN